VRTAGPRQQQEICVCVCVCVCPPHGHTPSPRTKGREGNYDEGEEEERKEAIERKQSEQLGISVHPFVIHLLNQIMVTFILCGWRPSHTHAHPHTHDHTRTHACTHTHTRTRTHTQRARGAHLPGCGEPGVVKGELDSGFSLQLQRRTSVT